MCSILNVSRSGYYARQKRPPGTKTLRKEQLLARIRQAHEASHGIYGAPRITAELACRGTPASRNTVAKYMREEGLSSRIERRFRVRTTDSAHGYPAADNLLARDFAASGPDQKWCCDITYVPTAEGFLYVAAVIDCCSRKLVGWSMADHLRAQLCVDALEMAIARRRPAAGLVHHSDRGIQYACQEYRQVLEAHGMIASMSRRGDCYDNALMESFWGSMKTEWTDHELYPLREDARRSVFEYTELFYNRQRRHSAIGYMSPEQFEASLN